MPSITKLITILAIFIQRLLQFGLGVDYGSEFHKSAMIIPGKLFKMVENQISKKKTETMISFCNGERYFERLGMKKRLKKKCDSFTFTTRFLANNPVNDDFESDLYLDKTVITKDDIGYLLEVRKNSLPASLNFTRVNEDDSAYLLRSEEINAMIMENNLKNAQRTGEMVFKEGVMTIPSNDLSIEGRKRIKAMNELAGFKTLALVPENTAAAVYQRIDAKEGEEDQNVLLVNVGSFGLKISLVKYGFQEIKTEESTQSFPSVTVIDDIYTTKVSGYKFDKCLSDYAIENHVEDKKNKEELLEKIDLYKQRRIVTDIKKAKENLGVNKNVNFRMQDFFDYNPLSAKLQRASFEEKCDKIFVEFLSTLEEFKKRLGDKGLTNADINSLEVIGGGVRVPKIQQILKEFYDMKVHSRINGDEGMALGAAFLAANYSLGMRTKKILLDEGPNYSVDVSIKFDNSTGLYKETELFPVRTNMGTKKSFSLPELADDLFVKLKATDQSNYEVEYKITGAKEAMEKFSKLNITESKAVFNLELDLLGIPKLNDVNFLAKEDIEERYNVTVPVNNTDKTNSTVEEEAMDINNTTDTTNSTNSTNSTDKTETITREEVRVNTKINKKRLKIEVINESYKSLLDNRDELSISRKLLRGINKYEEEKREKARYRNELESNGYRMKNIVNESKTSKYLNDEEKESYLEKSKEVEEFLFSPELHDMTIFQLKEKAREIETFMNPFEHRREEHKRRSSLYTQTMELFDKSVSGIDKIKKLRSWLPEDIVTEALENVKKIKGEVEETYQEQSNLLLNVNPVFTTDYVREKAEKVNSIIDRLRRMEKPKKAANVTDEISKLKEQMENLKVDGMDFDKFDPSKMQELLEKMKKMNLTGSFDDFKNMNETFNINEELKGEGKGEVGETEEKVVEEGLEEEAVDGGEDVQEPEEQTTEDNQEDKEEKVESDI